LFFSLLDSRCAVGAVGAVFGVGAFGAVGAFVSVVGFEQRFAAPLGIGAPLASSLRGDVIKVVTGFMVDVTGREASLRGDVISVVTEFMVDGTGREAILRGAQIAFTCSNSMPLGVTAPWILPSALDSVMPVYV
jgi:hypothetical protein